MNKFGLCGGGPKKPYGRKRGPHLVGVEGSPCDGVTP